jgi:hypothetical protein
VVPDVDDDEDDDEDDEDDDEGLLEEELSPPDSFFADPFDVLPPPDADPLRLSVR